MTDLSQEKEVSIIIKYAKHVAKNLWLYLTIIGLVVTLWVFDVFANLVGGYTNATIITTLVFSITGIIWLYQKDVHGKVKRHLIRKKYSYYTGIISLLILGYAFGGVWFHQNIVMFAREHTILLIPVFLFLILLLINFVITKISDETKILSLKFRLIFLLVVTIVVSLLVYTGFNKNISMYFKYLSIEDNIKKLDQPLESTFERQYPIEIISSLLKANSVDSVKFAYPDYVKVDGKPTWSISSVKNRKTANFIMGDLDVFYIRADKPFNSSSLVKISTKLAVGEGLSFSKNAINVAIKRLRLNYFNVFPTNTQHMKDGDGNEIAIVSLSKWDGWFFPTPEFYGVLILKEGDVNWFERAILGYGEIVKKENIHKYSFLVGQNLNSQVTTTFTANSFTFETGFYSNILQDNNQSVTVVAGELNKLPYIGDYKFAEKSKTYDFFELTLDSDSNNVNEGVMKYVWIPSDGIGKIYTYTPSDNNNSLISIKTLESKISSYLINYKKNFKAVEHRPFFKLINGKVEAFFLSSVVLIRDDGTLEYSNVETFITKAVIDSKPIKVDTNAPESWAKAINADVPKIEALEVKTPEIKKDK